MNVGEIKLDTEGTPAARKEFFRSRRSLPLSATILPGGVNFSLFWRNRIGVELVFFDRDNDAQPNAA